MLNPHAGEIIAQIDNPGISGPEFRRLLLTFTESLQDCVKREALESLARLAPLLASRNVSRASWVAEVCQALVESGCDSQVLARPLARGLKRALKATLPLAAKLEKKLAPKLRDIEDPVQRRRWTQSAIRQLAHKLPASVASLKTVERFCRAAFTVYGQQPEARPKVWRYLQDLIEPVARWNDAVADLKILLNVLEHEPLLVIDVANRRGFVGRFGGAVDNSQFLILLMDTYVQQLVFGKPLVPYDVVQCARGLGPCQVTEPVQGAWNVYTYLALNDLQKLPEPKDLKANKHWIWNEQAPAQIPCLDGFRIVLLGPPSYPRQWSFQRKFKHLSAGIKVDHELTKLDIQAWLDRIVQANHPHLAPPLTSPKIIAPHHSA